MIATNNKRINDFAEKLVDAIGDIQDHAAHQAARETGTTMIKAMKSIVIGLIREEAGKAEYQEPNIDRMMSLSTAHLDPAAKKWLHDQNIKNATAVVMRSLERASEITPCDLVAFLDRLYTEFDLLVDRHGLEKIKTTGDAYMVVSGVPQPRADHAEALAHLALDLAESVAQMRDPQGRGVAMRIGLASGPVVAGVVGSRRFFYDVWGDAVNVASRMESTDPTGHIQVPQNLYERLRDEFAFVERGDIDIKGKGVMHTWYLVGRR